MNPARFWDRWAKNYAAQKIADPQSYEHKLEKTRELLNPQMTVVEFGCGTGSTALAHAPYVKQVIGADFSSKMIAIAREKAEQAGIANASFRHAQLSELGLAEGSVDVVLGLSVLHLIEDRSPIYQEVHRILKPGGHLVTNTVCMGDKQAFLRLVKPVFGLIGIVLAIFSRKQHITEIEAAGFEVDYKFFPPSGNVAFLISRKR